MIKTAKKAAGNAIFQALKKFTKKVSDHPKFIKVINIVIINDNNTDIIAVLTILNLIFIVNLQSEVRCILLIGLNDNPTKTSYLLYIKV